MKRGALRAREIGATGYVPSLETFSFVSTHGEENSDWTKNRRQIPLGMGWLDKGHSPYREIPIQIQRMAYREFTANPDLPLGDFKRKAALEIFGDDFNLQDVADLFDLQAIFAFRRTWCQPSPAVSRLRYDAMIASKSMDSDTQNQIMEYHKRLKEIIANSESKTSEGHKQIAKICHWVLKQ
ncbi:MAG: hypothetical protein ACKO0V_20270, partial [bacterium]